MKKLLPILFFILLATGLLALVNIIICEALALAFDLSGGQALASAAVLGLFSASFIIASVIGSWWYNRFTRVYYLLSSVWLGLLLYLFIAAVIYGPLVAIAPAAGRGAAVLFLIAVIVGIYGILHARKVVVTTISVSLPNLPHAWRSRTAVWISDVHLGQILGSAFAEKIVTQISALAPDIIFVGGDLYDGTGAPDIAELTAPLRGLSAPLGVYFITGNHEEYGHCEEFLSAVEHVGMRILMDEMVELDGLQLIGVDYRHASDPVRFAEMLARLGIDRGRASLLLKHEPNHLDIAESAGISFQISGHTHRAQMAPLGALADMIYKGYAYGLKSFGALQVYTSSGTGTWGPPMRVGTDSEIVVILFG